jgi:hypothetical protein
MNVFLPANSSGWPREILINSNFVISSAAESHVYGRFGGVEKPAFVCARLNQSFPRGPVRVLMLLPAPHRELTFFWRHLIPDRLQILFDSRVARLLVQ